MLRILFVCHGNICRSVMAEYIFKDMVKKKGLENLFEASSAATTYEETGNDIYPPAKRTLQKHGIPFHTHYAHRITKAEEEYYDCVIGMDDENRYSLQRLFPRSRKISLLLDYTAHPRDVADPWYTRDFEKTYRDLEQGCRALLEHIMKET
ncbi:MAG: low molecular weight phosphotyrosine protein phosphatase [Solobacterium sp.]|nr:low molecular weight phosphotyrosine protein phosphatase [Solobacterium sp.]MBR0478960.1 low molecular weight phosphotyrosine protein phosphatase [Solobacterium sp.]